MSIDLEENRSILGSKGRNLLIMRKGGHSQKKNESILVGVILNFINSV
ncbi:MAG: hypothetical protein ACFFG0_41710 [Candidatus Thorarchaeota archaeon]